MKKLLVILALLCAPFTAFAVSQNYPLYFDGTNLAATTSPTVNYIWATSTIASWLNYASTTALSATTLCLTGDTCRTTWPTGGSGGSGTVSTSTNETAGYLSYWTSNSATPALLGKVATSSITYSSPLTTSGTVGYIVGGSGFTLGLDTSGTWSGNAGTATALAANGTNCSAGSYALGVDASGNAEGCTSTAGFATFSYPFPSNATSTKIDFSGGLQVGSLSGFVGGNNGLLYSFATSTIKTSQLTNDSAFISSIVADAPLFGSGTSASHLTWYGLSTTSQPTSGNLLVSNGTNGVFGVATGTVSAGSSAITVTAGRSVIGGALSIDCATAGSGQNGCLSSADWQTFNNKIGWGQATSTSPNQFVYTNNNGLLVSVASSSLDLPNSALQNDHTTVNGITCTLGSTCTISTTGSGLSTTSPISSSNLLVYSASGAGSAYGVSTSTLTPSSPLTGSFTQVGSGGTLGLDTSGAWTGTANKALSLAATSSLNVGDFNNNAGYLTAVTSNSPLSGSGTSGSHLTISQSNGTTNGYLSSTDWLTFNGKIATGTKYTSGNVLYWGSSGTTYDVATGTVSAGSSAITVTAGRSAIGGALSIDCATASASQNGCLSSTDWTTFNGKNGWSWPFPSNATSTKLDFSGGIQVGSLAGFIGGNGGTLYQFATSTIKTSQLTNDAGFLTSAVTSVGATYPIQSSGGNTPTISTAFSTTSNTGIGNNLFIYTDSGGIFKGAASSSLDLPNAALQHSTISGVALGSNLNTLTISSPLTGTSYNGSGGVSIGCQTASGSQSGCLSSTDWNTFNNKISWGAATSTSANQFVYTDNNGKLVSVASSTIKLSWFNNDAGFNTWSYPFPASATSTLITFNGGATTTSLHANGLADCNGASNALTYTYSSGSFGCNTITGGGGNISGWATSTPYGSQLLLYPTNGTEDVLFGGNGAHSTSTAPFWWDVNATTTYIGNGGVGDSFETLGATNHEWTIGVASSSATTPYLFTIASSTTTYTTPFLTLTKAGGYQLNQLTSNGFLKTGSSNGSLSVETTIGAADVSLANLTATNSTLTFSGTYNGSTARTIGLNLGTANTWTATSTFTPGIIVGSAGKIFDGASGGTTTIQDTNGIDLSNGSHGIHVIPGTSTTTLQFY